MKFFKKRNLIKIVLLLILLIIYICISAVSYANIVSENISESVFRLHVIANSDSDYDQNLKLKVRDEILNYMNSLCVNTITKKDAIEIVNSHIDDFKKIAINTIQAEGYDYPVTIEVGNFYFPTKTYGDISLPEGMYDSLKIKIGNADGHNWWCVLFPPLCFVDVTSGIVPDESKEYLKDSLDEEDYNLITADSSNNNNSKFKFKIVELVEQLKSKI